MTMLHAINLAIVEGLTEFLPISSTGHMIIVSWLLKINEIAFVKDFTVIVQFGAIVSVLVIYWRRFLVGVPFAKQEAALEASNRGQIESLTNVQAFIIGCLQCLAFVPGVSRSAATIIGGSLILILVSMGHGLTVL